MLLMLAGLCYGAAEVLFFASSFDNEIEIDNGFDEDLIVRIDDGEPFALPHRSSKLVRPSDGEHRIVATRPDGSVVEDAKFIIGETHRKERGFVGVYNIGGRSKYVIVELDSSGRDSPDRSSIRRYDPSAHFFEMPTEVTSGLLDVAFRVNKAPNTESLFGPGTVRLCTFDEAALQVGCPLCVSDYGTCGSSNHADERPFVLDSASGIEPVGTSAEEL